jgi:type IV fimbrial biogenesis protein FimT
MKQEMRGFTIIELMVVVALVGIIASFAVPSFQTMIANSRLASASNDLVGVVNFARAEAVKRGRSVFVSPTSGTDWADGVSVWMDTGSMDGVMQASEELRRTNAMPGDVSISPSASIMQFTGSGMLPNGASAISIDLCDGRAGETGTRISVTLGGRIRAENLLCS